MERDLTRDVRSGGDRPWDLQLHDPAEHIRRFWRYDLLSCAGFAPAKASWGNWY